MTSTVEERFQAAVNVIKGLPKNGSYQPSNDMMLRFYSYFKQGTQGPCKQKKPPFWDIVSKAKWDAWMSLRDMPRERAMECYVDELKKIIETMSYTDNVAQFMGSINELDGVNVDDLETVAPEIIKKARSHPNSPFASRESSPGRGVAAIQNGYTNGSGTTTTDANGYQHQNVNRYYSTVEQSDDEYIDTVESRSDLNYDIGGRRDSLTPVVQQILQTCQRMDTDLKTITQRINTLEQYILEIRQLQMRNLVLLKKYPDWWPFDGISPTWFVFFLFWPFLAQRFGKFLSIKKK